MNEIISRTLGDIASPDRLLTALMALLLVALLGLITGPLLGNANPLLWTLLDKLFGGLGRKAYRPERSPASLALRGAIFMLPFAITAIAIGFLVSQLHRDHPAAGFAEPLFLTLILSGGAVWTALARLRKALQEGQTLKEGSYYPIAVSTRVNLNTTDDFGITRVGIGFAAVSFDKAVVAPLFWYLIGGLPLAYFYAGVAAAVWALAREGFAKSYGDAARWLERIFGLIPHMIAALFLTVAALFTPTALMTRALPSIFRTKGKAPYAEGGLPVTVMANALNVSLGGPVQDLDGIIVRRNWVGPEKATARLDKNHLKRGIYLSVMAYVLLGAALVAALLAWKMYGSY